MRAPWLIAIGDFGRWLIGAVPRVAADFRDHGLRVSYLILPGLILVAMVVNLLVPSGWTVWPFVFAAMVLIYLHEAADRNGQGIPPGYVYLLFAGAVGAWLLLAAVMSVVNPFVVLLGVGFLVYYALQAYLKDRAARQLVAKRRADGRCVFCGEIADPRAGICMACGEEPDPDAMQLARIQAVIKNRGSTHNARTREALVQDSLSASARKKEAKLIQSSPRRNRKK